jgi:phage terminase large subunit
LSLSALRCGRGGSCCAVDSQAIAETRARKFHPVARCRWCSHQFVQVYESQWVCVSAGCRERQHDYAVMNPGKRKRGESPYLYLPLPVQVDIEEMTAKNGMGGGAAGGTKSHGALWRLIRRALRIPGFEALLLRRTFPELEKTHLRRMARIAPLIGADFVESKRLMRFPNGSLIEAGHCEDDADVMKYLSSEYDDITIDEASTFQPDHLIEIWTRARSSKAAVQREGGATVRLYTNPGGPAAMMIRDLFVTQTPDAEAFPHYRASDYAFVPARLTDNPYLDPEYAMRLMQLPEARRRQLLDGDWDVFESQFFPEWRAEKDGKPWHVADLDGEAEGTPLVGAIDWGYNQPGCFGWYRLLADGRLYKQADWKFQGMPVEDVAAGIRTRTDEMGLFKFRAIYCDPSMGNKTGMAGPTQSAGLQAESHAEVFARLGLPMVRSDNDRYHGWQRVHDYLRPAPDGRPWLVVSPRCRYTIRTIPALQQDKHDPDDCDTTQDDHAADETRYLLAGRHAPGKSANAKPAAKPWSLGWLKRREPQAGRGILSTR